MFRIFSIMALTIILLFSFTLTAYTVGNYSLKGKSIVVDNGTGLAWQRTYAKGKVWKAAKAYCDDLKLAGSQDWRLPNLKELQSIIDHSRKNPAIDTHYFRSPSANFWSADEESDGEEAWVVFFDSGLTGFDSKDLPKYVRCVRSK